MWHNRLFTLHVMVSIDMLIRFCYVILTTDDMNINGRRGYLSQLLPARRYASAVYIYCHRVSICPSQASIVSKRLNVGSQKQRRTIAQDCSFMMQKISTKF